MHWKKTIALSKSLMGSVRVSATISLSLLFVLFLGACIEGSHMDSRKTPQHSVVNDARLVAHPKMRYLGPRSSNPFLGGDPIDMTENQCTKMTTCSIVCGGGPAYATWCRCGEGKLTTFTYLHD